ncbi:CPBP family intramembrane metalloprotease [Formosa sediminum]|uniref:CPBP family intramembrane metalloprotease n=1 Tax=Formosa sediminum TaxID=2594004 RepID=A0A516GU77_9FLAO|nr:CPBP family intramembrane glutamic endopeptidase [Formosa sediminum]QDO95079.1 CPBP family intramembrane metalloprotease [Formosa sediminum]
MEILQSKVETYTEILKRYIAFLRQPELKEDKLLFYGFSKINVFITALGCAFILNFGFTIIFSILETLKLVNLDNHASTKLFEDFPPYAIFILGVIAAPILEELFFRGPLTLFHTKHYKYVFYFFALAFGFVHITNFDITQNVLLLSPILVAPQIIIGLFLGVIRLQYGLIYSMLFHAIYNGIIIVPALLFLT